MRRCIQTVVLLLVSIYAFSQVRVGDPGVMPDQSTIDANKTKWPQMERWSKAGVEGGVPFVATLEKGITVTNKSSAGINEAINKCPAGKYVYLPNGTYNITSTVNMKSGISLVGESKEGVKCIIKMSGETDAFFFYNVTKCGIYNLSIEGSWGEPKYKWNEHKAYNEELPDVMVVSVKMKGSTKNCWLQGVNIINSARHPLIVDSDHCTIRDCRLIGAHNKYGGYQGYFHVRGQDNLICYNYVTYLRHISMQDPTSKFNVWYGNELRQEISFHKDDDGDNLITHNEITLPKDMSDAYVCIMGTWSTKHAMGEINYIYKNKMLEENWGGLTPWSDDNIVYYGPFEPKPSDEKKHDNFKPLKDGVPVGGELYAVILGDPKDVTGVSVSPASKTIEAYESVSLTATVEPADATNKSVLWTSSNQAVAKVNDIGEVIGVSAGTATITATTADQEKKASCEITVTDPSCFDSNHPDIEEWAKAGVRGGIPNITNIKATLKPGDDIQKAINDGGTGVVLLTKGTYLVKDDPIIFKSGVVLRGVNKDEVTINVDATFKYNKSNKKRMFIMEKGVSKAAIEDLKMVYVTAEPKEPVDNEKLTDTDKTNVFNNNEENSMVTFILINGTDCWVENVDLLKSGSDPIKLDNDCKYSTLRNVFIDRCYNKGNWGHGYVDIRGDYNLITGCTVKRIRHFTIQLGAKYNVVIDNDIQVDVNFHNGDDGHNLIERNKLTLPAWHSWELFATGGSQYGHAKPGPKNVFYNNTTWNVKEQKSKWGGDEVIYTFEGYGRPKSTTWKLPKCGTFYAVTYGDPVDVTGVSVSPTSKTIEAYESVNLTATVEPADATNKTVLWTSSNDAVAKVNDDGIVIGISEGKATITATTADQGKKASCEITVTAPTKRHNVALYKTATANGDDGNSPSGAIDGDVNTRWSNQEIPSWIEIDLGSLKSITSTEVICYKDRAYQFTVEAKASENDAYTQIVDRTNNTKTGSVASPIIDNFDAIDARFVKLTITGADGYTGDWVSIMEIRVMGMDAGSDIPDDTEKPTSPTNLQSSNISETGFTINWNASTDNIGVKEYDVFVDGAFLKSVNTTSATLSGLDCGTDYNIAVSAKDEASNVSDKSNPVTVTTSDCSNNSETIELKKGWNLIGCPYDGSTAIETALSSILDKVIIVKDFDRFYDKQNPTFSSLKELEWGRGYFIKVSEDCTLKW